VIYLELRGIVAEMTCLGTDGKEDHGLSKSNLGRRAPNRARLVLKSGRRTDVRCDLARLVGRH